jgi:hypothetical protein
MPMGWGKTLRALQRRWYVLLIGVIATAGLGWAAWQLSPPMYVARGTELLLPPTSQVEAGTRNPLLELGSLDAPASLVIGQLDGQQIRAQVYDHSPDAEYTVENDPSLRGPAVLVTLSDTSPQKALSSLRYVLDFVPETLASLQKGLDVPETATVTSMQLAIDTKPEADYSSTTRTLVLAVGGGLVVTVGLAVGLDAFLRRNTVRRKSSGGADPARAGTADDTAGGGD